MRTGGFFIIVLAALTCILGIAGSSGCANIIPPTGGPRDSLPPKLLHATPPDSALHAQSNTIVFDFDEYLDLKEAQQNLMVNPVPKGTPSVDFKLRTMTVKLKDTLLPNTTYSLNFGNSVRDINEGNILRNFTYVFSTGSYIDSLQLKGKVLLAISGKADSTLLVILHSQLDDSAVAKFRPRYATKVDSQGNFNFRYLAPGTYAIYALKDEGSSKRYMSATQLFAFADSPVVVSRNSEPVNLYAYADTTSAKPAKKTTPQPAKSKNKEKEKDTRLVIQANIASGVADLLTNFEMHFQTPLKYFDTAQVKFTDDQFKPITGYKFVEDTDYKKIVLDYKLQAGATYKLILGKDFAEDTLGKKLLKTDTVSFKAKEESDYGSLKINFTGLNVSKHPVLQFIQGQNVKFTRVLTSSRFFEKLVPPAEYELRILYDDNQNGVWDGGVFFGKHQQPEKVQLIKPNIKVRANWDNEYNISL